MKHSEIQARHIPPPWRESNRERHADTMFRFGVGIVIVITSTLIAFVLVALAVR
jgi:hypothetical protein